MKCKELYTINNIEYGCGKLYGPFPLIASYEFSDNKKGMKTIIPIKDHNYHDNFYAEMDEYDFFKDVIMFGKQLYNVFKSNILFIKKTWQIPQTFENSIVHIVSEKNITEHFSEIKDICQDFINNYTYCFIPQRFFPISYIGVEGIPLSPLINHSLFIFMLHTVFEKMSSGYDEYKDIYEALSIHHDTTDSDILDTVIDYINIYSMPHHKIAAFNMEILRLDNNVIPITVTSNIFAYAFEVLQNNISSRTFYSFDQYNDVHNYVGFRKCTRCLKNIVDNDMDRQTFMSTPKYKKIYCDDCKKELRRISSNKYEHTLRTMYDELKNNINKCNTKLANEIRNLQPKDKETKSHLQRLYSEYLNETKNKK